MEPLRRVSRGKTREADSEKTDYRNLWRLGRIVHMDLFYRRGKKREYKLQGLRLFSDKRLLCGFPGKRFAARFGLSAHSISIKHSAVGVCKERWSISH